LGKVTTKPKKNGETGCDLIATKGKKKNTDRNNWFSKASSIKIPGIL